MDKPIEKTWEIVAAAIAEHAWLSIPLVVAIILSYQFSGILRECLRHRREMWQLKSAERQRQENVARRQRKAAERKEAAKRRKPPKRERG
jgi:hypothetical protein